MVSILLIAVGVGLFLYQLTKIDTSSEVTEKYNMTVKNEVYYIPTDERKKVYLTFNSNYKTEYMIAYDNTLKGKFKVETRYFECYYDYYTFKTSNNVYISLRPDDKDRLSRYISDLKDKVIYSDDELARYLVKITINEEDLDRVLISN